DGYFHYECGWLERNKDRDGRGQLPTGRELRGRQLGTKAITGFTLVGEHGEEHEIQRIEMVHHDSRIGDGGFAISLRRATKVLARQRTDHVRPTDRLWRTRRQRLHRQPGRISVQQVPLINLPAARREVPTAPGRFHILLLLRRI